MNEEAVASAVLYVGFGILAFLLVIIAWYPFRWIFMWFEYWLRTDDEAIEEAIRRRNSKF